MNPDEKVTYFAETDARGKRVRFGIKAKDRSRHMYVIGKTGMGKSTLLENMAIQDIQNGEGMTFIDPHGSTAEKLLDYIPESRIKDVLYFAPFDLEYPVSFNVLEQVEPDKRHLVVSGLMATFEKIWVDAWSARMAYILQNTLLALLEYPGATILGVNRMYADKDFRKRVIDNLTDPTARAFWVDEYSKYTDRYTQEATPAIQNKIGQFASNSLVRNIIGQPRSSFDIRKLMDERKIFIVNLSKGRVGEGNANLLGSMLITKIYLAAMSRADSMGPVLRGLPNSYLYVDEFQSFANRSFADILSEARKYKLNLTIAHQYVEQMEEEVRAAVFGNVGTMVAFRVGSFDAETLEKEFAPIFTMEDIVNLGFAQIYLKLMIDGVASQPFSATTLGPIMEPAISHRDRAIANSRAQYAARRADTEEAIRKWHEPVVPIIGASSTASSPRSDEPRRSFTPSTPRRENGSDSSRMVRSDSNSDRRPPRDIRGDVRDTRESSDRSGERPMERRSDSASPRIERVERTQTPATPQQTPASLREVLAKIANTEKEKQQEKQQKQSEKQATPTLQTSAPTPRLKPAAHMQNDKKAAGSSEKEALKAALAGLVGQKTTSQTETTSKTPRPAPLETGATPRITAQVSNDVPDDELRKLLYVEEPPK